MKNICLLLILLGVNFSASAQIRTFFDKEVKLFGIHNPKTKRIFAPAIYQSIEKYKNFYVVKNTEEMLGVLSNKGKLIIPCEYTELKHGSKFSEFSFFYGKHMESSANRLLNEKGEIILGDSLLELLELRTTYTKNKYQNNYIRYRTINNKYGLLSHNFEHSIPPIYTEFQYIPIGKNEEWFYVIKDDYHIIIDINNTIIYRDSLPFKLTYFSDGLAPFIQNNKCGFVNEKMEYILEPNYVAALPFENGASLVKVEQVTRENEPKKYLWGLINTNGEYIINPKFDELYLPTIGNKISWWNYGYCIIIKEYKTEKGQIKKYGLIHTSGKEILEPVYNSIQFDFENFDYILANLEGKWGMYNQEGEQILPHEFAGFTTDFEELKNEKLFPIYYNRQYRPEEIEEVFGYITNETIRGFYNLKKKKITLDPRIYDYIAYEFENDFFLGVTDVEYAGRFGLINKKGKTRVPIKYKYEDLFFEDSEDYTKWKQFWKVAPKIIKHWFVQ